jgi:hypothetical protein
VCIIPQRDEPLVSAAVPEADNELLLLLLFHSVTTGVPISFFT